MQRGFGEPPGVKQRPGGLTVQRPFARSADLLVNHVPDERMLNLVDQLAGPLALGDRPPGDQGGQDRIEPLSGQPGQRGEVCQRQRALDHRQQVEHRSHGRIGPAGAGRHPFGQTLGQPAQAGSGQVCVLLEQRADQADDVQRITSRPLPDPFDERRGRRLPDNRLGQLPGRVPVHRGHFEPLQESVLVQLEQRLRGDLLPGQIGRPAGGHDQQPGVVQVPGEVPQCLPRGGVGEVHVVDDGDDRRLGGLRAASWHLASARFWSRPQPKARCGRSGDPHPRRLAQHGLGRGREHNEAPKLRRPRAAPHLSYGPYLDPGIGQDRGPGVVGQVGGPASRWHKVRWAASATARIRSGRPTALDSTPNGDIVRPARGHGRSLTVAPAAGRAITSLPILYSWEHLCAES
jgi:hypothetical protein